MTQDQINAHVQKMAAQLAEVTEDPQEIGAMIGGLMLHFTRTFGLPDVTGAEIIEALARANPPKMKAH